VQNTYYYINKLNYGAITTVGTPLGITEMRAAVARDRGDILRLLNQGMARVRESGEYDRLYRKWFVRELNDQERQLMLQAAVRAAIPAYAPYGKKGYGAAVLTATGKVYSACTVENADLALSLGALRGAVSRAVADGEYELRAAVVVDAEGALQAPAPEDLQVLTEFGRGVLVISPDASGGLETPMVAQLLPKPVIRETGLLQLE
jgi:cytidine deaminase